MPKYTMPVPTRQEWQKLRDSNKVPKGSAKVSIGDSLDAFHKSFGLDTMSKHQQATVHLIRDTDLYLAAVKTKYPAFAVVVAREVRKKAETHKRFVDDQIKAKTEFYPRYSVVIEVCKRLDAGQATPKDVAKSLERLLGCAAAFAFVDPVKWDPRRLGLNRIMSEYERAPAITPEHKRMLNKVMVDIKPS